MFAVTVGLTDDPTKPATADDIVETIRNVRELAKIAEHEMHEAVLSCTRARRQMLKAILTSRPILH